MPATRRDLLKIPASAMLAPLLSADPPRSHPTVETLTSICMTHRFGDLFNPPALTNFWGCAQAALDVCAVRSVSFPPLAQGEASMDALGGRGDLTGLLFVDGVYATAERVPIQFTWRPDRIERRAEIRGLRFETTTIVPFGHNAVLVAMTIHNTGKTHRDAEIKLLTQGGVTRKVAAWSAPSPGERNNERNINSPQGPIVFHSHDSSACSVQSTWPVPNRIDGAQLVFRLALNPGESKRIVFGDLLGSDPDKSVRELEDLLRDFRAQAEACRDQWNATLAAAFTPGSSIFSGYLPQLITTDRAIERLYYTALISVLFLRRTTPQSVNGTTYVTLGPRYWNTTSFLWDTSLSAMLLALLDPTVLRRMIETWMRLDIHKHFGTEYLTGGGVGPWYSVNDFAMCRMSREYLRWTGDFAWLDKSVAGERVIDRLTSYAVHWRALDINHHGLADYGGVENLLEAVSSYVHEVASLNAANVFCLRFAAELWALRGDNTRSRSLTTEASALGRRVLELYVQGAGFWNCRLPDGALQPVRHCYDFATVLTTMPDLLTAVQMRDMVRFFSTELKTPAWMRALSMRDPDVAFGIRPDHQWTGAYAAWPAISLSALYAAAEYDMAAGWMRGLALSAMQGPIGQAHFSETAFAPETDSCERAQRHNAPVRSGARKAPSDVPYITDWACVAGGAFLDPILEGLFGIRAPLHDVLSASPQLSGSDPKSVLRGLRYQGKQYMVSAAGVIHDDSH